MTDSKTYDPERVRQGEIILRHGWSRGVFFAALVGLVALAAAGAVAGFVLT